MGTLNPDYAILDKAEMAYIEGAVEAFKAEQGLVGDIALFPGYLSRGHPQRFMHGLNARLYEHRYGGKRLTEKELRGKKQ